jgi:CheY-like chemotaxis protein
MRVFLVDDDNEDHEIFKIAFSRIDEAAEIITADHGIEALLYLQTHSGYQPDIIFLDVNMPRMNGKDCVRELRKIDRLRDTPIILHSTHDCPKEVEEAAASGASGFMSKPAGISEYVRRLQGVLREYLKLDI